MAIFPSEPGYWLASTGMSPFWILLEIRMTKVVVTTGAIRRAKLQSNRHYRQTNLLTHSLLRLTSEGRIDLHNERSCADDHSKSIVHP